MRSRDRQYRRELIGPGGTQPHLFRRHSRTLAQREWSAALGKTSVRRPNESARPFPGRRGSGRRFWGNLMADRPPLSAKWFIVEPRNHVQMRMVRCLSSLGEAVPHEHVPIGSKPFILLGLRFDEKLVRRHPLLRRELERRQAVRDRDDDTTPRKHIGRITGITGRGVQAQLIFDTNLGRPKLSQITEDARIHRHRAYFYRRATLRGHSRTLGWRGCFSGCGLSECEELPGTGYAFEFVCVAIGELDAGSRDEVADRL